jgi:hypothetical protein
MTRSKVTWNTVTWEFCLFRGRVGTGPVKMDRFKKSSMTPGNFIIPLHGGLQSLRSLFFNHLLSGIRFDSADSDTKELEQDQ